MADETTKQQADSVVAIVGHEDGDILLTPAGQPTGEKVVYDFDKDGQFAGWHKAPAE